MCGKNVKQIQNMSHFERSFFVNIAQQMDCEDFNSETSHIHPASLQ